MAGSGRKGELTRAHLIAAATDELLERGDLGITSVAARAGVSPGLPYRYFASKSELASAVVDAFFDRFDAAVFRPSFAEIGDWGAREALRTARYVAFFYDDPLAPLVVHFLTGDRLVVERQRARFDRQVRAAAKNIARGRAELQLPSGLDPGIAAALVMGGLNQALLHALTQKRRPSRKLLTSTLVHFVATTLGTTPMSKPGGATAARQRLVKPLR